MLLSKKESIFSLKIFFNLFLYDKKLCKFLLVGLLNTIFGYSIFALAIFIGFHYSISLLFSTILGIIFNFHSIGYLVFKNTNKGLFIKFLFIYLIVYIFNLISIKLLFSIGFNYYVSAAFMVIPAAYLSFILLRTYVFIKNQK